MSRMLKVRCGYCGEEMDCPENILKAEHICSFCADVMEEGMSKEEIARLSRKERRLSPYFKPIVEMADTIFSFTYKRSRRPREELKEISKREVEKTAFHGGIFTAFAFLLHTIGPKIIEDIKNNPKFRILHITDDDIEEMVEHFKQQGIDVDVERFKTYQGGIRTVEDIEKMINYVIFKGDWEKQLEWEKKHGHKEDVEIIKKMMETKT